MSRSLDHRHRVRLYVEKVGLWNPADAWNVQACASSGSAAEGYVFAVR
jgi:hypothetical protein